MHMYAYTIHKLDRSTSLVSKCKLLNPEFLPAHTINKYIYIYIHIFKESEGKRKKTLPTGYNKRGSVVFLEYECVCVCVGSKT